MLGDGSKERLKLHNGILKSIFTPIIICRINNLSQDKNFKKEFHDVSLNKFFKTSQNFTSLERT